MLPLADYRHPALSKTVAYASPILLDARLKCIRRCLGCESRPCDQPALLQDKTVMILKVPSSDSIMNMLSFDCRSLLRRSLPQPLHSPPG